MEYRKIKNINLYVRPEQGEALVTVPLRTPRERVERFLYEKEGLDAPASGADPGDL